MNTSNSQKFDDAPALVLDLHYASVQIGRCLGKKGIRVYGIDKLEDPIGVHSRYVKRLNAPLDLESLKDFLITFANNIEKKKPVLFPLSDYYIQFFSQYAQDLAAYYCFPYTNLEVIRKLVSKVKTATLLEELSIPHPKTIIIKHDQELLPCLDQVQMPCILKPEYNYSWEESPLAYEYLGAGQRVLMIDDYGDLKKAVRTLKQLGNIVIQEFVEGPCENSYYFVGYRERSGMILLSFLGRKIHTLPDQLGSETLLQSIYYPELLDLGNEILEKLDYVGPIGIDFKYDRQKSIFIVIEINPRIGINDCYLAKWGCDVAWLYYANSVGICVDPCESYPSGILWVDLLRDFDWMREYGKQYQVSWCRWVKRLLGKDYDCEALMDKCDKGVFWYTVKKRIVNKLKHCNWDKKSCFPS